MSRNVALIYTRVSVLAEKDRARAISPEMQLERCKELPALRGMTIEHFEDLDYSGKSTKRPGYQAMLERIARGDVAIVAAYSLSRVSRSVLDLYGFYERELKPRNVDLVLATDPVDTSTATGRAFMGSRAVWNQMEREITSERIRDAAQHKIGSGRMAGSIPAGYRRVGGKVEPDSDTSPVVRLVFAQYATGLHSYGALARWLNKEGHRPPRSPDLAARTPTAELFSDEIVRAIVSNPRYAGLIELADGSTISGEHEALIDKPTWAAALRVRQAAAKSWLRVAKRPYSAFALSQIIRCPMCGGPMRGDSRKRDARDGSPRYGYYACKLRRKDPSACSQRLIPSGPMEEAARYLLSMIAVPAELADAFRSALGLEAARPQHQKATTLKALEERLARLDERFDLGFMDRDAYAEERRRRMEEIETLRAAPAEPVSLMARREELRTLVDDWDASSIPTRRALVATVFESLQPTASGGIVAQVRPGWRQHAAAAAAASRELVCLRRRRRESNPR